MSCVPVTLITASVSSISVQSTDKVNPGIESGCRMKPIVHESLISFCRFMSPAIVAESGMLTISELKLLSLRSKSDGKGQLDFIVEIQ